MQLIAAAQLVLAYSGASSADVMRLVSCEWRLPLCVLHCHVSVLRTNPHRHRSVSSKTRAQPLYFCLSGASTTLCLMRPRSAYDHKEGHACAVMVGPCRHCHSYPFSSKQLDCLNCDRAGVALCLE